MSLTTIRLREAWDWGGLSARELAVRTYQAMDQHDTLNRAAVVAYYAMLSLVPFLSLTLAVAVGARTGVAAELESLSQRLMPPEAHSIVSDQIHKLQADRPVGLISLSIVILLWSASSLFVAVMDTTNASYGVRDDRPWWKRRLIAIVLTMVETVLLVVALVCIAVGPEVLALLNLGGAAHAAAIVVQWLIVVVALLAAFAMAYYFGPHVEQEWEWITPGSALGVLALIVASLGFRLYLHFSPSYSETYGALAGVVLMLLWLYLAALALLVGAEINCVIEHAAPHGRAPGQKQAPQEQLAGGSV
jgi:membrane protein